MSRKEASFSQLIAYMDTGAKGNGSEFTHNLYPGESFEHVAEFEKNSEHMSKRKGGVFLYHEILSFKNNDTLEWSEKSTLLQDVAREYLERRSGASLAYGVIHDDKDHHTHIHLCISANGLGDSKRVRQSKAQFQKMKVDFEKYVLATYPELGQEVSIDKSKDTPHTPKGGELKRRKGRLSKKEETIERFRDVFTHAKSKEEFFTLMGDRKLEIYTRGKTVGFLDLATGKKHRLKTLGLDTEFERLSQRLDLEGKRQVIDYQQGKGRADRVERPAPVEPKAEPRTGKEQGQSKGEGKTPDTEPHKSSESASTVREWVAGDFSERDARIAEEKVKARKEAYRKQDQADKEKAEELPEDKGRFGTAREWIAGDFSAREAKQRQAESEERLNNWKAERQKMREQERSKEETKAQEEKQDKAALRRAEFQRARDAQGKDSPSKDSPDKER